MFTGLIKERGSVISTEKKEGGYSLLLEGPQVWTDLEIGESIALNGICLTLEAFQGTQLRFFVGLETLAKTNFQCWKNGDSVNLERSLRMGDRLGGHIVSGHVDGTGLVESIETEGDCRRIVVNIKNSHKVWVVNKGSISINGISLTVNEFNVKEGKVELYIIPETMRMTNLSHLQEGDFVNIEFDQFVKVLTEKMNLMKEAHAHNL